MPMRLVHQKRIDGCAVACLAIVTGQSYDEARHVLHPEAKGPFGSHWTNNMDLLAALNTAGFGINVRVPCPIQQLKSSILVVRYEIMSSQHMHTVVWDAEQQRILDPFPFQARPLETYQEGLCLVYELDS